jgi:CRISPR-associated endoribonuclease Cas6
VPAILDLVLDSTDRPELYPARMHGAACALLGHPEPNGRPRFSVSPLVDHGDRMAWRLGWLADSPCRRTIRSVLFGDTVHPVVDLHLTEWSFAELATSAPTRRADIEIHSPMYFSRGKRDHPLPDPVLIIQSLAGRWNHHAPEQLTLPPNALKALLAEVYLAGMDGRTVAGAVGHRMRQTGFVGDVTLALTRDADNATAALFTALLRYADIAGIGAQTGHGFGAVRATPRQSQARPDHPGRTRTDHLPEAPDRPGPRNSVCRGQRG